MWMKKTSVAALALAFACTAATAQQERCVKTIEGEIERLADEKELQTRWGDNAVVYYNGRGDKSPAAAARHDSYRPDSRTLYFKYLYEAPDTAAPPAVPRSIRRMEESIRRNAAMASAAMARRAYANGTDLEQPEGLTFACLDSVGGVTAFSYPLDSLCSYATATFDQAGGIRTNFTLVWRPEFFYGKDSTRYCAVDGYVAELKGRGWEACRYFDFVNGGSRRKVFDADETVKIDTLAGCIVASQVELLAGKYKKASEANDRKLCDSVALMLRKLAEGFAGTLSKEHYNDINCHIESVQKYDNSLSDRSIGVANTIFRRKSECRPQRPYHKQSTSMGGSSEGRLGKHLCPPEDVWYVSEFMGYPQALLNDSLVAVKISGTAAPGVRKVYVGGTELDKTYAVAVDGQRFAFGKPRISNTLVTISDGARTYYALADTVPLSVDMGRGITGGSDLNMRFMAVQDSIAAFEAEAKKYSTTIDGRLTVTDSCGFAALMSRLDGYVLGAIESNRDNAIHVWLLYNYYFRMTRDGLSHYADSAGRFANQPLMQPVVEYAKSLERLKPGTRLANAECWDVNGTKRSTAEFLTNDYTLIYLYFPQNAAGRTGVEGLKRLYDSYHDRGLGFVCHAFTFGFNGDIWKWFVRRCGMERFTNIFGGSFASLNGVAAMPLALLVDRNGCIVACEQSVDKMAERVGRVVGQGRK